MQTFKSIPKGRNALAIMDEKGDTKISWDPREPREVAAAKKQFEFLTREQHYQAFKVDPEGEYGEKLREFDPKAARIILVPQVQYGGNPWRG